MNAKILSSRGILRPIIAVIMVGGLLGGHVQADNLEGASALNCAALQVFDCEPGSDCTGVAPEKIGAPRFIRIDLKGKKITGERPDGSKLNAIIGSVRKTDRRILLQGLESDTDEKRSLSGATVWMAAIATETGNLTFIAATPDIALVFFGACTPETTTK